MASYSLEVVVSWLGVFFTPITLLYQEYTNIYVAVQPLENPSRSVDVIITLPETFSCYINLLFVPSLSFSSFFIYLIKTSLIHHFFTMAATELTEWPPGFPDSLKNVIALYFTICNSHSPDVGDRLATEIFTPSGCHYTTRGDYKGSEGKSLLFDDCFFLIVI